MANIVLGCDKNGYDDAGYQNTVAKVLEQAGHSVHKLEIDSNAFASYSWKSDAKGKIGIYLIAAGTFSIGDAKTDLFDYNYFGIRPYPVSPNWRVEDFDTKPIGKDPDSRGGVNDDIGGKSFKEINEIVKDRCMCVTGKDATEMGNNLVNAIKTGGFSSSSDNQNQDDNEEEEEEDWDDKDNFTPHKGKIMEIKPYKEIASIGFDKSYDSPTGSGNVEILYTSKDYRFIYKGVAMKLKLRRSCDKQWSATGLEEPDYDENEKFFKEHIPTDELLKELGLPNYRKQRTFANSIDSSSSSDSGGTDDSSTSGDSSSSGSSSSSSSGSSSSSSSSSSGRSSSSSSSKPLRRLSGEYINSITPAHAKILAQRTNEFDTPTIKRLRRRAMGLFW